MLAKSYLQFSNAIALTFIFQYQQHFLFQKKKCNFYFATYFFKMGASTIVEWRKELGERFGESYKNVPFSKFFEKTETTDKK